MPIHTYILFYVLQFFVVCKNSYTNNAYSQSHKYMAMLYLQFMIRVHPALTVHIVLTGMQE